MFWFFAIPMLIIGGLLVIELLILSYEAIAEAIRKYKEEKNKKIVAAKIKKKFIEGDYNCVKVGLLDRGNEEIEEIVLRAEEDANDYRVGQRIRLT